MMQFCISNNSDDLFSFRYFIVRVSVGREILLTDFLFLPIVDERCFDSSLSFGSTLIIEPFVSYLTQIYLAPRSNIIPLTSNTRLFRNPCPSPLGMFPNIVTFNSFISELTNCISRICSFNFFFSSLLILPIILTLDLTGNVCISSKPLYLLRSTMFGPFPEI